MKKKISSNKYINFLYNALTRSAPVQLTLFVTSRCNIRCKMCFYWEPVENKASHEISLEEIDKISKSIRIATRKRPIDSETIEKFISKIVRNLEGLGESEIPTPTVGKFIMDGLSVLDKVAYVRFASVYKNFKEVKDFEQFVGNINENKS